MLSRQPPPVRNSYTAVSNAERAARRAALCGTSLYDHSLFVQLSSHVYDVIAAGFSDGVLSTLLLSLRSNLSLSVVERQRIRGNALRRY
ncbi:hypothetical protein ABIE11_002588 [Lelliottia sp. 489]